LAIVVPKPDPPYFLDVDSSACVKELKILSILFLGIPTPVSSTENNIVKLWLYSSSSEMPI